MKAGRMRRALLLLMATVTGCAPASDRAKLLQGMKTMPCQASCLHTGAPDVSVSLPAGFVIEPMAEATYDMMYIYDPLDTGSVQKGLAVLNITPIPVITVGDVPGIRKVNGVLNGMKVTWNERAVFSQEQTRLYQKECIETKSLRGYYIQRAGQPLKLHVLVVGTDSMLVERLTACVETLKLTQQHPNL